MVMRKSDALIYAVMAIGFAAIAWTAWGEPTPAIASVRPTPAPYVMPAQASHPGVKGRRYDSRPLYEYKLIRVPRLLPLDDDDERRHEIMMRISYRLCYGFTPFYGHEDLRNVMFYNAAQDALNERDAEEFGPEGLKLYQETHRALCDWDVQMWHLAMFRYGMTASGPDRPAAGAMSVSVDALAAMLESLTDEKLAAGLAHPKAIAFTAVKARLALVKPEPPYSPADPDLTFAELREHAKQRDELLALTEKLGRIAAAWPPAEQQRLADLLLKKLEVFDGR
jgi:hypothetical protein